MKTPTDTDAGKDDPDATCSHDYEHYVTKGRARYHCPKCDADISLEVVLMAEAEMESENA